MHLNILSSYYPIICLIIINLTEIIRLSQTNYPLIVNLKVMHEPNHTPQQHTAAHPAINNSGEILVKLTRCFLSLVVNVD